MALATNTTPGEIQLAGDLAGNNDATAPELTDSGVVGGLYELPKLTIDSKGRITASEEITGSELTAKIDDATTSSKGVVQVGDNINVSSGVISVSSASDTVKGVVQIDVSSGLGISAGILSIDTSTFPIAADGVLGLVQVPASSVIEVDVSGNITVPDAGSGSPATKGVVSVAENDGLTLTNGVITFNQPIAADGVLGFVQVPTSSVIDIDGSGNLTAADATGSTPGVVQIGNNINVSSGVISVPNATNAVKGVVSSANTNNVTIVDGLIDAGPEIPRLSDPNVYTGSNVVSLQTLVDGSVNANASNTFYLQLTQNITLQNPTNLSAGQTFVFIFQQDGIGSRTLSFQSAYKFREGEIPETSIDPFAIDLMTCVTDGTEMFCSYNRGY